MRGAGGKKGGLPAFLHEMVGRAAGTLGFLPQGVGPEGTGWGDGGTRWGHLGES